MSKPRNGSGPDQPQDFKEELLDEATGKIQDFPFVLGLIAGLSDRGIDSQTRQALMKQLETLQSFTAKTICLLTKDQEQSS